MKIAHVVGARPNFMKVAPLLRAFEGHGRVEQLLIHTGQHYDEGLSDRFFADLEIPRPDINLEVGSGSHGLQTGRVMIALEPVLQRHAPDWVFTVGDVNSTVAAALTAAKLGIRVAHVEAGLRSGDWCMPEEINRVLTDRLSDALFTTEPSANENLRAEGIQPERIHYVGNVMIDTLEAFRSKAKRLGVPEALGLEPGRYVLVTLHRPGNVDDPERLRAWLLALKDIAGECERTVVLPLHPRTATNVRHHRLDDVLASIRTLAPLGYMEFLCLMDHAGLVLTDSGGVQEETTVLGVPCITLRPNTERPITIAEGTNRLYDGDPEGLLGVVRKALAEERRPGRPHLWDGKAAERIAAITVERLAPRPEPESEEPLDGEGAGTSGVARRAPPEGRRA